MLDCYIAAVQGAGPNMTGDCVPGVRFRWGHSHNHIVGRNDDRKAAVLDCILVSAWE